MLRGHDIVYDMHAASVITGCVGMLLSYPHAFLAASAAMDDNLPGRCLG